MAARSWDPSKSSFKTYLGYRIPGAIKDGFRERDHLSRNSRKHLVAEGGEDVRLYAPISIEEMREAFGNQFDLADQAPDVFDELREESVLHRRVEALFHYASMALDWRQFQVLHLYYREGLKLWQIGQYFEVTESRACQMLAAAEYKLRRNLRDG